MKIGIFEIKLSTQQEVAPLQQSALPTPHEVIEQNAALQRTQDSVVNENSGQGTQVDSGAYSRFGQAIVPDKVQCEGAYANSHLFSRIIDVIADDMTSAGWEIVVDPIDEEDDVKIKIQQVVDFLNSKHYMQKINKAIKFARVYGGAVIVLGVDDPLTTNDEPLSDYDKLRKNCLISLTVLDRFWVFPWLKYTFNPMDDSVDLYTPIKYIISLATDGAAKQLPNGKYSETDAGLSYAHNRVLAFHGVPTTLAQQLQNGGWYLPVLASLNTVIVNHQSLLQATTSLVQQARTWVYFLSELKDSIIGKGVSTTIRNRIDVATRKSGYNSSPILDAGDRVEVKDYTFSGLDNLITAQRSEICAGTGIPMTKLFGESPGGINGTGSSELMNYYSEIGHRQSDILPQLLHLVNIAWVSVHGKPANNLKIKFKPLQPNTPVQGADIGVKRVSALMNLVQLGILTPKLAAIQLNSEGIISLTHEQLEEIDNLQALLGETQNPVGEDDPTQREAINGAQKKTKP